MNATPTRDFSSLTKAEIDALFAKALAGVMPANTARIPIARQLEPLKPSIHELRAQGFSMQQLNDALATEHFGIKTTPGTLSKSVGAARGHKRMMKRKPNGESTAQR